MTRRVAHRHASRRGFSLMEVLVVAAILGIFASLVIPGFAQARVPFSTQLEHALEADLRLARTEAIARSRPVSLVVADGGRSWWLADAAAPQAALPGTMRTLGAGTLHPLDGISVAVRREGADESAASSGVVAATFDALGSRDASTVIFEARATDGRIEAEWTLLEGRSRLTHLRAP